MTFAVKSWLGLTILAIFCESASVIILTSVKSSWIRSTDGSVIGMLLYCQQSNHLIDDFKHFCARIKANKMLRGNYIPASL